MNGKFFPESRWFFHLVLVAILCPLGGNAALTGYLKIDSIPGESQAQDHEREIEVFGLEWKVETEDAESGGVRDRGRAKVTPVKVKKRIDKSSPLLALASMNGQVLPEVVLAVRKDSGEAHLDYLVITLSNVRVSSYCIQSKDGVDVPVEEIGFTFQSIKYKYVEQADDHSAGDEHEIEYDVAAGV